MFLENLVQAVRPEILVASVVLLLLYILGRFRRHFKGKYPPGPTGIPIFGYLPFLTKNPHFKLMELAKKYGDVFSLRLGSETVVVLSGCDVMREAFGKTEVLGRPPHSAFSFFKLESPFFSCDMNIWHEQRKFVLHALKDLGLGKSRLEEHIKDEIRCFTDTVKKWKGKPVDLLPHLTASMSNNICSLVFGKRYDYDDPERIFLNESLEKLSSAIGQTSIHIFFPWIKNFPFLLKFLNYDKAMDLFIRIETFFREKIKVHTDTLEPNNIRDFIDSYVVEMRSRKIKDPDTTFTESMLAGCILDLFGAGSETVRTTLSWCLYVMAAYPEIQKKVQREITEIVGPERMPELQDQKQMPYSQSVVMEVMRWKTVVPLNLLRYTLEDTVVGKYTIPKDTIVMANFWAAHHDPKYWTDPESFVPDRFLSTDGKTVVKSSKYMPFSVGKRACPGETMANMEVFLYFMSILQKFDIALPDGATASFDAELTITYHLRPHEIRLIPKH